MKHYRHYSIKLLYKVMSLRCPQATKLSTYDFDRIFSTMIAIISVAFIIAMVLK